MKNCPEDRTDLIVRYVDGDLTEDEMLEFEAHYLACEECHEELSIWQDSVALIRKDGPTVLPAASVTPDSNPHKTKKPKRQFLSNWPMGWRYASFAFGSAAILIIGGIVIFGTNNQVDSPPPSSQPLQELLFKSDPFKPHSFFESRLTLRNNIKALPANNHNFAYDEKIVFQWEGTGVGSGPFEVEIFDNEKWLIFEEKTEQSILEVELSRVPGLYYWTLSTDDALIYVGRYYELKPDSLR